MSKKLVAYFSASGVTENIAKQIVNVTGADLYEIEPIKKYTSQDLDWRDKTSRSSVEMSDTSSRPEIATKVHNMDKYDVVFVGYPIWWYREPSIIDTFLEAYDFSDKLIIPFATSGGSDFGDSEKALHAHVSTNTKWEKGKMLNNASESDIKAWIGTLGI